MKYFTEIKSIGLKKFLLIVLKIIIGTAIMAFSINSFLLPNKLSTGGFSGIATLFFYLLKIPVGNLVFFLNIPLFLIAFIKFGKSYFLKIVIGTFFLSFFINIFQNITALTTSKFLACVYGGLLSGTGAAIVLNANSSTGGSDLLAQIIKWYKPNLKTGSLIVGLDTIIVLISTIVFKEVEVGLYSAIAIYIMGKVLDVFFEGIDFAKMLIIVSPKYKEISDVINKDIKRGTTALYGRGMYKQDEKKLILCVASRREVGEIRKIVSNIDSNAFLIITNAKEVYGKGFKK